MREDDRIKPPFTGKVSEPSGKTSRLVKIDAGKDTAGHSDVLSPERLEHLLSASPAVIYSCGTSGNYPATFVSSNVKDQLGYEPEQFLDDPDFWAENIHPEEAADVFAGLPTLFDQGHYSHEYRFRHKDGTWRWMLDKLRLIRNSAGEPLEILGSWMDITLRKQTEEALRESEARFRSLFELSRDGIFAVNLDGRFLMANPAAEILSGYTEKELKQLFFLDICTPECREATLAAFDRGRNTGGSGETETILIRKDGRRVDLLIAGSPMLVDGKIEGAYCIARDITENKIAEQEMQKGEDRFRQATEAMGGVVYEADLVNLTVSRWSGLFDLLGYRPDKVPDRAEWWWQQIHPDDFLEFIRMRSAAIASRSPVVSVEYRIRHHDGRWLWVSDSSRIIYDDGGRATRLIGCTVSVDERRKAQESLLESEARHRRLFESDIIGMIYTDVDKVVDANDVFLQMVGYTREDLQGGLIKWRDMTPPEFLDRDENAIKELLEKGSAAPFEKEYIRKYGSRVSILIGVALLQREPLKCVCFVLDITERKWMEEELRSARDELEKRVRERTTELESANRILQQIPAKLIAVQEKERKRIAGELHDSIGQTLVAVKLGLEAVLLGSGRGSAKDKCKALEVFIPTLQHLIKEIKLICMGLRPTMLDDLGLVATLQWLCGEFRKLHPNHSVKLEQSVMEDEVPANIKIEIFRITQEAMNNAAKHSKADLVNVSLVSSGNRIELIISDDGIGMDLDFILQTRVTRLGLTSMRERAERTGGDFSIVSAPGEGTTIRASWPIGG